MFCHLLKSPGPTKSLSNHFIYMFVYLSLSLERICACKRAEEGQKENERESQAASKLSV